MPAKKPPRKKKAGRPRTVGATGRFVLRVPPGFEDMLDEWIKTQPDRPSRSEAVRRLVEMSVKGKKE